MTLIRKFFGLKLETAAMLIGYLEITAIFTTFCIIIPVFELKYSLEELDQLLRNGFGCVTINVTPYHAICINPEVELRTILSNTDGLFAISVIASLISVLLIIGAKKQNRFCLIPWLVRDILALTYFTIQFILILFIASTHSIQLFLFAFILVAIIEALGLYCFVAIYSLYLQIKSSKDDNVDSRIELV